MSRLALLLFAAPLLAAEPDLPPKLVDAGVKQVAPAKITAPKPATCEVGKRCILTIDTTAKRVTWRIPAGVDAMPLDGKRLAVWALEGRYTFLAQVPNGDDVLSVEVVLTVTGPRPPPTPPAPKPPVPTPSSAPIPHPGFRVMIVYQDADSAKMPREQLAILTATPIRNYFRAKCVKEADGGPGARIWDADVDPTGDLALWQEAFKRPRGSLPWLIVSNGTSGYEGPLPGTVDATLQLLRRYGGE